MLLRLSFALLAVCLALVGCGPSTPLQDSGSEEVRRAPALPGEDGGSTGNRAPDQYQVKFETTKGDIVVDVTRAWSPNGADRFYELVQSGFYDDAKFFRVVPGFMVQFGIAADPAVMSQWRDKTIRDDSVVKSNKRGYVTFAKTGAPHSRSTQVFINYGDNEFLDQDNFSPFGIVTAGMDVAEAINSEYAERPNQGRIQEQGNKYLNATFPRMDGIVKATVIEPAMAGSAGDAPATEGATNGAPPQ